MSRRLAPMTVYFGAADADPYAKSTPRWYQPPEAVSTPRARTDAAAAAAHKHSASTVILVGPPPAQAGKVTVAVVSPDALKVPPQVKPSAAIPIIVSLPVTKSVPKPGVAPVASATPPQPPGGISITLPSSDSTAVPAPITVQSGSGTSNTSLRLSPNGVLPSGGGTTSAQEGSFEATVTTPEQAAAEAGGHPFIGAGAGGAVGFFAAGPVGAAVGAVVGYFAGRAKQ